MRRKKVLMCTEASYLPTGYAVYSKEVLSRLHKNENLEIAELGCYSNGTEEEAKTIPWKFYPNKPPTGGDEWNIYKSMPVNEFGEYKFHDVLVDFMPDFVTNTNKCRNCGLKEQCHDEKLLKKHIKESFSIPKR